MSRGGVRRLYAPGGVKKKGSVADRESGVALCHGVALKKKKIGRGKKAVSLCAMGCR